jgi:hypothetical protein
MSSNELSCKACKLTDTIKSLRCGAFLFRKRKCRINHVCRVLPEQFLRSPLFLFVRFQRIAASTIYFDDLRAQGFPEVDNLLKDIHERRNEFTHGDRRRIRVGVVTRSVTQ